MTHHDPWRAIAVMVIMALPVAAFPSSAQEDAQEWPETVVVFGDPGAVDHEGGWQEWECEDEQLALAVTDHPGCGDFGGEHVRTAWSPLMFGFRTANAGSHGPVPLTGTLRAHLEMHDGPEWKFECKWDRGAFRGCTVHSWPPLPLGTFTFSCYSLEGAIGGWAECFLAHGG